MFYVSSQTNFQLHPTEVETKLFELNTRNHKITSQASVAVVTCNLLRNNSHVEIDEETNHCLPSLVPAAVAEFWLLNVIVCGSIKHIHVHVVFVALHNQMNAVTKK